MTTKTGGNGATVITFGIQKGGCGKSLTSSVIAYLLSKNGNRVLLVDADSQGNATELLTQQEIYTFQGRTTLEAMQSMDATDYVHPITDNLHLLPAEDLLATLPRFLYRNASIGNKGMLMEKTLAPVKRSYDYIIIDTPPALGDQTINALAASDYVVVMAETSKFCYSAIPRFLATVYNVQAKLNPNLRVAGILRAMIDSRRSDSKAFLDLIKTEYEDMVFDSVITRKAAIGRLPIYGFDANDELDAALEQYNAVLGEMLKRVKVKIRG